MQAEKKRLEGLGDLRSITQLVSGLTLESASWLLDTWWESNFLVIQICNVPLQLCGLSSILGSQPSLKHICVQHLYSCYSLWKILNKPVEIFCLFVAFTDKVRFFWELKSSKLTFYKYLCTNTVKIAVLLRICLLNLVVFKLLWFIGPNNKELVK